MNTARRCVSQDNPARIGAEEPNVLQLSQIPVWMLRAGLSFLGFWLVMALLGSPWMHPAEVDLALGLEPVFLGLGVAFTLYGIAFHIAINIAHWRQVRVDDHEAQVMLSGRKRFERRKEPHAGRRGRRH